MDEGEVGKEFLGCLTFIYVGICMYSIIAALWGKGGRATFVVIWVGLF